ncbi:phenylacetate--CoA ligase family protein [Aquabacterium olei]|uniref:phenylacetate--CoA ligase family protein n=1 Tax=Aquabacterium olei TaxID=1296669 RepID=UPI001FE311D7|nr:AMP-binding protein [Aquabacterium olei]
MYVTQTSGSTGEPVRVARTERCQQFWMAYGLREHQWWNRDFSRSLFVIRANLDTRFIAQKTWGSPASLLATTGAGYAASMSLSTAELALLIEELRPGYLLVYPNVLVALLQQYQAWNKTPRGLLQVRTMGETLGPGLRNQVRDDWGVETADTYSSQEAGVIAIECPSGSYHVMAENLIVEVLKPDGTPCAPGETGEVVITDLHNYATPLIRYAIGDVAEVGGPCACGRHLPTLTKIHGRVRNLITYPDGSKRWPRVGFDRFRDVAPITQYQVVQHAVDDVEVRLVCSPLSVQQETALNQIICTALESPFPLRFTYWPGGIPRRSNGKYEEVISLLKAVPLS